MCDGDKIYCFLYKYRYCDYVFKEFIIFYEWNMMSGVCFKIVQGWKSEGYKWTKIGHMLLIVEAVW